MIVRQIRYFLSVVNQGSINKASVVMGVSQQSLSSSMCALEEELGTALFVRSNKGVQLTESGRIFAEFAYNVWAEYERMEDRMHPDQVQHPTERLRVGTVDSLTTTYLPSFLIEFTKNYPWIRLSVFNESLDNLAKSVEKGEFDCALVFELTKNNEKLPHLADSVVNRPLAVCKNYCWVSTRSPLAMQQSISLKQNAAGPLVFRESTDVDFVDQVYEGYDANLFDFPLCTDMHMISEIVANNMAICPDVKIGTKELTMARMFSGLPVVAVPVRMPSFMHVDVHIISNEERSQNECVQLFVSELLKYSGSSSE